MGLGLWDPLDTLRKDMKAQALHPNFPPTNLYFSPEAGWDPRPAGFTSYRF